KEVVGRDPRAEAGEGHLRRKRDRALDDQASGARRLGPDARAEGGVDREQRERHPGDDRATGRVCAHDDLLSYRLWAPPARESRGGAHAAVQPPSTGSATPVTNAASSLAR